MADNDRTGGFLGPIIDASGRITETLRETLPHAIEGVPAAVLHNVDALVTNLLDSPAEAFEVSEGTETSGAPLAAERDEAGDNDDEADRSGRSPTVQAQQASAAVSPAMDSAQAAVVDEEVDEDVELHSDESEAADTAARRKQEAEEAQEAADRQAIREEADARAEAEQDCLEAEAEAEAEAADDVDPASD